MVLKRTRSFWNSRRFLISTPGKRGDAMDTAFRSGDQRAWHFECPACHQFQPLKFKQLKWDWNDTTKPEGKWRFDALAETIRFECVGCGHRIKDTPVDRRWIENHGHFVPQNPNAPRSRISYTWNALLPHWIEWRTIVDEFLSAVDAMRVDGDIEPMFTFVTETLGEPWEVDRWLATGDDYLQERKADYDFGDPWPIEKTRFIAADRQARGGEHYFWVCRMFGPGCASRLVSYGRCNTTSELEEIRKQLNVPVVNAMIDTGFKASEVLPFLHGDGLEGDERGMTPSGSSTTTRRTGKTIRRVWRRLLVDPSLGAKRGGSAVGIYLCSSGRTPASRITWHLSRMAWSVNGACRRKLAVTTSIR